MPKVFSGLFGGGGGGKKAAPAAPAAPAGKKLFSPEQITKATTEYGKAGEAKWNQIMAGMGAGGGTGGDLSGSIANQAATMGQKLAELTDASGYGSNINDVMKQLEGGIGARYAVY